jgi:hypothetical protein
MRDSAYSNLTKRYKMKIIIYKVLILSFLCVVVATSCRKTQTISVGPDVEFVANLGYISSDTAWASGDTAIIALHCTWDGKDKLSTIHTYYNGKKFGEPFEIDAVYGEEYTFRFKIIKSVISVEKYSFEVVDSKGDFTKIEVLLQVDGSGGNIVNVQFQLAMQNNPTLGSYFSFDSNIPFNTAYAIDNPEVIDMVGGYDNFVNTFLSSPACNDTYGIYDFSSWSPRNETLFCPTNLSPEQFDLITRDNLLISSFNQDIAVQTISNLEPNSIFSFKAPDGRFGLLLIQSKAEGDRGAMGFDYKIQVAP